MQRRERFDEKGNLAKNKADRPVILTVKVYGDASKIVEEVRVPLTEFRIVRGKPMGGGLSAEALRRARRNAARGS